MGIVTKSVLTTLLVIFSICMTIYVVFWKEFKQFLVTETIQTMSDSNYMAQMLVDIINAPNSFLSFLKPSGKI